MCAGAGMMSMERPRLTIHQLLKLAEDVTAEYFPGEVEPLTLASVAYIESEGNPKAMRTEPDGQVSVGLCQTLCVTSKWLITDTTPPAPAGLIVSRPVGAPVPKPPEIADPTQLSLMDPFTSMWYGAAYLSYLGIYGHKGRTEEWTVRAYNAGPTGVQVKNTNAYWAKYCRIKLLIETGLRAVERGGGLYQVEAADTMWKIAQASGITMDRLLHANPQIADASKLNIGDLVVLPPPKGSINYISLNQEPSFRGVRRAISRCNSVASSVASSSPPPESRFRQLCEAGLTIVFTVCAGLLVFKMAGRGATATPLVGTPAMPSRPIQQATLSSSTSACAGAFSQKPDDSSGAEQPSGGHQQITYTIKEGDTLFGVAKELGVSVNSIQESNPELVRNPDQIPSGMRIVVHT
mmetsp:Transcript_15518/g.43431  ORF Transcript_15518/g.43431 Transcript_15518/m.43431 type:complete len:407 (-) Transcript_15518:101-1321(-)